MLGYEPGLAAGRLHRAVPRRRAGQRRRRSGGGSPGPAEITLSAYSTADPEWSRTALRIASLKDQVLVRGRVAMVTGDAGSAALLTWLADDDHVLTVRVGGVPGRPRWSPSGSLDDVTTEPVGVAR